jgi:hypothetical protein
MPHPRAVSIVLCSCGWRIGNSARAALHEDLMAVEHALIAAELPRLVRHWQLGHRLTLGENAPREFLATIARAAQAAAGDATEGETRAPAGLLESGD